MSNNKEFEVRALALPGMYKSLSLIPSTAEYVCVCVCVCVCERERERENGESTEVKSHIKSL
jgi:hypothetical protein